MVLDLWGDLDLFPCQDRTDPFGGPSALGSVVDPGQRLQRDRLIASVRQGTTEIMPIAAHGERGRADRSTEVERKHLGVRVTAELHCHQRQQDGFASTCR